MKVGGGQGKGSGARARFDRGSDALRLGWARRSTGYVLICPRQHSQAAYIVQGFPGLGIGNPRPAGRGLTLATRLTLDQKSPGERTLPPPAPPASASQRVLAGQLTKCKRDFGLAGVAFLVYRTLTEFGVLKFFAAENPAHCYVVIGV
jgi:hypothetical protein